MTNRPDLQRDSVAVGLNWILSPGPNPEPPIDNPEFLEGFLQNGVWLRVASSYCHLAVLRSQSSSEIQRLAALVAFYQQAALQAEDILSNLIVWSIWARDRSQNLVDLLSRLMLRDEPNWTSASEQYRDVVWNKFEGTSKKKIYVDARQYLSSLLDVHESDLPAQFGISWKRDPSVKDVPRVDRKWWDRLPNSLGAWLRDILNPRAGLFMSIHNKLKHGPQLIVTNRLRVGLARGFTDSIDHEKYPEWRRPTVRILLDGSRTDDTKEEFEGQVSVAPLLADDVNNAAKIFDHVIREPAWLLATLGEYIFKFSYPERRREFPITDKFLREILEFDE
jgi:hypothetical protein